MQTGGFDVRQTHDAPTLARQGGFALILAMLALLLLTFLGLTLATTTSTELQIATNYRWSEQALYNAEAGVEVGRILLRGIEDWNDILPSVRNNTTWNPFTLSLATLTKGGGTSLPPLNTNRDDQWGNPSRNYEAWQCDRFGRGVGHGVVLDDSTSNGPYQYKTTMFGRTLTGAFTIWVRRPSWTITTNNLQTDYAEANSTQCTTCDDDNIVMVVEGVAPFTTAAAGVQGRAVRLIEVTLSKAVPTVNPPCGARGGQVGGGSEGSNFSGCDPVTGAGVAAAFGGAVTVTAQDDVK
jgi:hypothetical protein